MSKTMNANFPGVMRDHLRAVRFRHVGFAASLRALAFAMTALLIAMIMAMVVDWAVTLIDVRVRVLLTLSCLLLASAILWWTEWRRIRRALGWTTAAVQVDYRIPQMEERWRTVASLAEAGDELSDSLARAMLSRVKGEAVVMSRLVRPDRVIRAVVLQRPMIVLTSAMVALEFSSPATGDRRQFSGNDSGLPQRTATDQLVDR